MASSNLVRDANLRKSLEALAEEYGLDELANGLKSLSKVKRGRPKKSSDKKVLYEAIGLDSELWLKGKNTGR